MKTANGIWSALRALTDTHDLKAPTTSAEFDREYRSAFTFWGDVRVPKEVKSLAPGGGDWRALELGCGVGRYSRYLALQGCHATGVDFSPVAIAKAQERVSHDDVRPEYLVGDVTHLDGLTGPFDISFDVGCFHCLDSQGQRAYVAEVFRLLKPGGTHLIWALDSAPSNMQLSPAAVREIFARSFALQSARKSRRRIVQSHWYWLVRSTARAPAC
jgi:cyclopropane fatty-acyl-phospholipid synthase-like methyltransferase